MPDSLGDSAQIRQILEQIAKATVIEVQAQMPRQPEPASKVELPAPLKWAAGILAAILSISASGGFVWLVTTVNEMQVTLARMDERMEGQSGVQVGRFQEIERRVTKNEAAIQDLQQ